MSKEEIIARCDLTRKHIRRLIDLLESYHPVEAYLKTLDRQLVEERRKALEEQIKAERNE